MLRSRLPWLRAPGDIVFKPAFGFAARKEGSRAVFGCQQPVTNILRLQACQTPTLANMGSYLHRRPFSSTTSCSDVRVTANPRVDDEGQEMLVDITERASQRLKAIMTKDANPGLGLRVEVQSGGCHGFQYLMSLMQAPDASPEEDTVFEATDGSGAKVVMDEPSLQLLKGSKVDYTTELIGSQFKIVGNPAASSSCGCGTSFDIKT